MSLLRQKLKLRDQEPVLLIGCPAELEGIADTDSGRVHSTPVPGARYPFALAFARSLDEATRLADGIRPVLAPDATFWLAYPKKSSKQYRGADIDRDFGYAAVEPLGFRFVAMVAIDDDRSAMRFKEVAG